MKFKILIYLFLLCFFILPTVRALTVSPDHFDITVEKGKETEITEYIQIMNSATNPVNVYITVSGSISEFISLERDEFNLPAGPGPHSDLPRTAEFVKLTISVPREVPESKYSGEVVFSDKPTTGGVLGTSVQLGVRINLNIGTMAKAEFPIYVTIMIIVLIILIILSIVKERMRRFNE